MARFLPFLRIYVINKLCTFRKKLPKDLQEDVLEALVIQSLGQVFYASSLQN